MSGRPDELITAGFDRLFTLEDIADSFELIDLVSFKERRKLSKGNELVIVNALESGSAVGGTAWHIEYNNLSIIYAIDLSDKET